VRRREAKQAGQRSGGRPESNKSCALCRSARGNLSMPQLSIRELSGGSATILFRTVLREFGREHLARSPRLRTEKTLPPTCENLLEGAKLYVDHRARCRGVPSNADNFSNPFYPTVPSFFKDPHMRENQAFHDIAHGIRSTGMPARRHMLTDEQVWQIVIFLSNIERLPPAALELLGLAKAPVRLPGPMHMAR
jgi:hypothetical protein